HFWASPLNLHWAKKSVLVTVTSLFRVSHLFGQAAMHRGFGVHFQKMYKIFGHSLSNSPVSFIPHVVKVYENRLANITKYRADVMKGDVPIQPRGTLPQRSVRVLVKFLHARIMNIEF